MHAIQISHRCSDPDRRGHASAAFESWLDSTARSALAPMVAAPARHRRCFDIRETIVVSIACIICRLAQSGRLAGGAEMSRAVLARLPADLFPGGAKADWWVKTVQLDPEAKGVIARQKTKPLRLHRS